MKKTYVVLLLGTLTLALLAFAYVSAQAMTGDNPNALLQVTGTPGVEEATDSQTPVASIVELWSQFCVKKIPYTLLALPENASFEVALPEETILPTPHPAMGNSNEIACTNVGIFRGMQVVVCRGPAAYAFPLQVSDGATSEEFEVPLKACGLQESAPEESPEATPVP